MRRLLVRPLGLAVVGFVIAAALAGVLLSHSSASSRTPARRAARAPSTGVATSAAASLPPPKTGFTIPQAHQLARSRNETRWAPVLHTTDAHAAPDASSPVVVSVSDRTPEGTTNLVDAESELTRDGTTWVHARLAVLPDGRTGWIPRSDLGGWSFVDTRVVVDEARLTLTLYRSGRVIFRTRVGVGEPGTPTPTGVFYIRDRLTEYASPEYGPLAFGTSARSEHLTDWPAGGFIGIHGTNESSLIPGRISHGCIRLRNADIVVLGRLLPVGTPVIVK